MSFTAPTLIQQSLPSGAQFLGTVSSAEMGAFVDIARCLVIEAKQLDALSVVNGQIMQQGRDVFVKATLPDGFKTFQANIDFGDNLPPDLKNLRGTARVIVYTHAGNIYFCNPLMNIPVPCLYELQQDNGPGGMVFAQATPDKRVTKMLNGSGKGGREVYLHAAGGLILHAIVVRSRTGLPTTLGLQGSSFLDLDNPSPDSRFYHVPGALLIKGSAVVLELIKDEQGGTWCRAKWTRTAPNDIVLSAMAEAVQPEDIPR